MIHTRLSNVAAAKTGTTCEGLMETSSWYKDPNAIVSAKKRLKNE